MTAPAPLLAVEAAQARLLGQALPLPAETVPLRAAAGRWLAADCFARRTQPPFAASAMDGYAIRWEDRAGPWRIVGEAAAGRRFADRCGPGEAVRILTGAPLADGADTVVVQEDVRRDGDALTLVRDGPPRLGAHIRRAGIDFTEGAVLARAGERLTPARLGLLASGGYGTLPVARRPVVALLATGDELVLPGVVPGPDQIVGGNSIMLAALFAEVGATVVDGGIVPDRADALRAAIEAHAHADVLVTIGGASVGDHDLVRPTLDALGAEIDFWRLALRPGKPMLSGRLGTTRVLGLPGNPVSAFVTAQLFVVPLLRRLAGAAQPLPVEVEARLAVPLGANDHRRDYLRARWEAGAVTPAGAQDSSLLSVLAGANALVVRAPFAPAASPGTTVGCLLLDTVPGVA